MTAYEAARATLADLNARIRANVCPKVLTDADVPAYVAWQETARALTAEGRVAGFIRIFDGSFKLNLAKMEVETHDKFGGTTGAPLPGYAS